MPEMLLQNLWKNHYKVHMQRQNELLQNLGWESNHFIFYQKHNFIDWSTKQPLII